MLYFTVSSKKENLREIRQMIASETLKNGFSEDTAYLCTAAVDEMLSNIFEHSIKTSKDKVHISVMFYEDELAVVFRYKGGSFSPPENTPADIDISRIAVYEGGLGLSIILRAMDRVTTETEGDENVVTLYKKRPSLPERGQNDKKQFITEDTETDNTFDRPKDLLDHYIRSYSIILNTQNEEEVISKIALLTSKFLLSKTTTLLLADKSSKKFMVKYSHGTGGKDPVGDKILFNGSLSAWTYLNNHILLSPRIEEDSRFKKAVEEKYFKGPFVSISIVIDGDNTGVFNLCRGENGIPFTESEIENLNCTIGPLLLSLRLYKRTLEKQKSILDIISVLTRALDAKDPYTAGHSERVMQYSMMMANRIGLTEEEREIIRYASLLHDIGKIGIKESILNKEESLSHDESYIMKNHPAIGMNIIKSVGALSKVAELVHRHHEHWDGSGYPDGLKGEKIPLGARIIQIADSFEAMTSDRPYQKALSKKEAVKRIRESAGTMFDPRLVMIFNEVLDEIMEK